MRRRCPAAAAALAGCAVLLLPALAEPEKLAPAKGWRLRLKPEGVLSELPGAKDIPGLVGDATQAWPERPQVFELRLDLAAAEQQSLLLFLGLEAELEGPLKIRLEGARGASFAAAEVVEARTLEARDTKARKGPRVATITIPGKRFRYYKLVVEQPARLTWLRLYKIDRKGPNDAWLFVGSSLTVGGIDPEAFAAAVRERFPGFDPVVLNTARVGWTSQSLRDALPQILAEFPAAHFVAIDIGGNDVSIHRPHPGGAKKLSENLAAILELVKKAGKVPILARLSYRAYPAKDGKGKVPPEEHGAAPYNAQVYDPLIERYCPNFFDKAQRRGVVELYDYFKAHPEEIGPDGIHLKKSGYQSWSRIWLDTAAARVYGP